MFDQVPSNARERVLIAAETLFRQRGYNVVTMRDIAQEVGIRQASLYYHFPSKEQLFITVIEQVFERHRNGLQQALAGAGSDLSAQLHAASRWFISQPPINFLCLMRTDMPALSEEQIQRLSLIADQSVFDPIRQAFIAAQEQGQIRYVKPNILAGFFLSIMDGINYASTLPATSSKDVMASEMVSVLLDGLRPQ
ncbi:MAG TPA: TetR/AcrR family transcriptional regulator [Coleofasciculaceae cyanobacterium]